MKEKTSLWLAVALMVMFALTRWPGLMPPNFSAAYALAFCAGVYFPRRIAWWLPLVTLAVSDLAINAYYHFVRHLPAFQPHQLMTYVAYLAIIALGRRFPPQSSWVKLLSGGLLGAVLFYLLTNTASWWLNPFKNPEYTKTLAGWITALTHGTAGHPPTWEFFRNTLMSGGLFTGLFVGAMKLSAAKEPAEKEEEAAAPEEVPSPEAEESKA